MSCINCGGTRKCPECKGTGRCPDCDGTGTTEDNCSHCGTFGDVPCDSCAQGILEGSDGRCQECDE